MKISAINSQEKIIKTDISKQRKNTQFRTTNPIENNPSQVINGVPVSYVSFKAKKEFKFAEDAQVLFNIAQQVAKQSGHEEITPAHIIDAAIKENTTNLSGIDPALLKSGVYEYISALNNIANKQCDRNLLLNEDHFNYFLRAVEDLKADNDSYLSTLNVNENSEETNESLPISESLTKKLKEIEAQVPEFDAYMLLGCAFNASSEMGITHPSNFLKDFMSLKNFRTNEELLDNYMKFYDDRAIEVWNKLALGSNLFVTYNDEIEANRIISSMINTLSSPKKGIYNDETTFIYPMSSNISPEELVREVQSATEAVPDKNKIFLINLDDLVAKAVVQNENGQIGYPAEVLGLISDKKDDTKYVFFQHHDSNFQLRQNPYLKKFFTEFISYSIPPMRTYEAQELFNNDKSYLKDIKSSFTKDARNKAVIYADKVEGSFPDKAVDFMKRISAYYGNEKKKITVKDVDDFALVAKDLFNSEADNSSVIYDTGKNINSLYGKDTTKKDIEAIVRQIRTGKIGTRGYVMYSKDEEAGSGRRFTAQALAGEAKVPFLEIASSDFATTVADEENGRVIPKVEMSKVFAEAKKAAEQNEYKTAIIYVNNFEDFAFSGPYLAGYKQAMAQMEKEMIKAENENLNIVVIGSTDAYYAEAIPLVVRGFNQNIAIDSPAFNNKSRYDIIKNRIKEIQLPLAPRKNTEKEELLNKLVKITEFMSFVEIKSMVEKTEQIMAERGKTKASLGDFIEAYLQLQTGRTSRPEMPEYNKRATTSHECGHATNLEVMSNILKEKGEPWHQSHNVNFITLDPRGNFLGAVFEGRSENSDYPFEAMFTGLVCAYGGYSCEKLFFDMDGSSGISQDLAQATAAAKVGVEKYGFGHHTGKISNRFVKIESGEYCENVYKDTNAILKNAQLASDLITETYRGFNEWFTDKYSKLIGTDDCMVDGDTFRAALAKWKQTQMPKMKDEFAILDDMIMDIIKCSKKGKVYGQVKKIVK